MSATTALVFADDDEAGEAPAARGAPVPGVWSFVDPLVARLHAQYGGDPQMIRRRATELLAAFAGARVQAFVPILVEKQLREFFRRGGPGRTMGASTVSDDSLGGPEGTAVVGRRRA